MNKQENKMCIKHEEGVIDAMGIMWANARKMQAGEFEYKIEDGVLTLPDIESYDDYEKDLEKLIVKEGVTKIENYTFSSFERLKDVSFPNTLIEIGEGCFQWTGLSKLELPDSIICIGAKSFCNCNVLIEVTGGKSLQVIGEEAFAGCSELKSIVLPEGLVSICDNAFDCCSSLESIKLPSTLISIGSDAFSGCSIRSVTIPGSVTTIGDRAFNCGDLEVATVIDSKKVVNVGYEVFPSHTRIIRNR